MAASDRSVKRVAAISLSDYDGLDRALRQPESGRQFPARHIALREEASDLGSCLVGSRCRSTPVPSRDPALRYCASYMPPCLSPKHSCGCAGRQAIPGFDLRQKSAGQIVSPGREDERGGKFRLRMAFTDQRSSGANHIVGVLLVRRPAKVGRVATGAIVTRVGCLRLIVWARPMSHLAGYRVRTGEYYGTFDGSPDNPVAGTRDDRSTPRPTRFRPARFVDMRPKRRRPSSSARRGQQINPRFCIHASNDTIVRAVHGG